MKIKQKRITKGKLMKEGGCEGETKGKLQANYW